MVRIGVPREVKNNEYRVAITPHGVRELTLAGHDVLIETAAGAGSSITDEQYRAAGARILTDADSTWGEAEMVLKVKEPVAEEYHRLRDGLVLFTFLHLAAEPALTEQVIASGTLAIAYETVTGPGHRLPLLEPMSEVAGRMAPQVGAHALERESGGRGMLLGGVTGVAPARVAVVGAGTAGRNAAALAAGLQAQVTVFDIDLARLAELDQIHQGRVTTLASNRLALEEELPRADLVIGAVLVPGARAPHVITRDMVGQMRDGAVLVDIAIDQGGCAATSRMTTHDAPTYIKEGVVHYAVGNMPGAVPHTSTYALTNATIGYVHRLADGVRAALTADGGLRAGVNVARGRVTNRAVADAQGSAFHALEDVLDIDDQVA